MTNMFTNRQRDQILHQLAKCHHMDISQYAETRGMWEKSAFQFSTFTDDQKLKKETDCINCVKLVKKVCLKEKSGENTNKKYASVVAFVDDVIERFGPAQYGITNAVTDSNQLPVNRVPNNTENPWVEGRRTEGWI